jgi:hypothetical protein
MCECQTAGAANHWVVNAMPHGGVPAATADPGIFVSAPVLPIEKLVDHVVRAARAIAARLGHWNNTSPHGRAAG